MRKLLMTTLVGLSAVAGPAEAIAQSGDMSCAEYLKADAQAQASLSAEDKALLQASPEAAAIDAKMRIYCKANPKASASEAATRAIQ
jgi:hypothetical protein